MNTPHKHGAAILVGSLTLVAFSTFAPPAQAGKPFGGNYCHDRAVYGNTLQYYPTTTVYRPLYRTTYLRPTYNFCPTPIGYPVTLYDAFGRPYVVYTTSYPTLLR